jgi:tRNA A37 threonylcarbamoyltransferase TsaD
MGEAFDKVARLLGISAIPGGPHLERLAAKAVPEDLKRYKGQLMLPLRRDTTSCNFSFRCVISALFLPCSSSV